MKALLVLIGGTVILLLSFLGGWCFLHDKAMTGAIYLLSAGISAVVISREMNN